ncbi:hypothetical protein [Nocardia barduliensis]|uniref:hypothetical protein n=1 Tax=Nocardia barduliensis TaxID=2736643 RepID=UPI001573D43B|nr:hypothetical protein [Nocardia barduliensis]
MAAESTTSSRRWWAPIGLGAAICLGCCLAPMLIAAGVLGGGITLLSLSWLEPLGFTLLAAGVAGLIWSHSRARRTGCTSDTDSVGACTTSGCGCATTVTS